MKRTLEPHEYRVVEEFRELRVKREKLGVFLASKTMHGLPTDEQDRMRRQFDIMVQYEGVLQERIDHFPEENDGLQSNTKSGKHLRRSGQ